MTSSASAGSWGSSQVCLRALSPPSPHPLTAALVHTTTLQHPQAGLDVWLRDGNVFACWHSMWDVIWHGELGSSLVLLNAGTLPLAGLMGCAGVLACTVKGLGALMLCVSGSSDLTVALLFPPSWNRLWP